MEILLIPFIMFICCLGFYRLYWYISTCNSKEKELVYLAVPYTHSDPKVMEERYEKVCIAAGTLISRNYQIYSPISQFHSVAKFCKLPTDWNYWRDLNKSVLECCRALLVLTLDGWKESVGVQDEIEIAKELGLPIDYLEYEDLWRVL